MMVEKSTNDSTISSIYITAYKGQMKETLKEILLFPIVSVSLTFN